MSWSTSIAALGVLSILGSTGFAQTSSQDQALEEIRKELAELRKQNQDLQKRLGGIETSPLRGTSDLDAEILQLNARLASQNVGGGTTASGKDRLVVKGDLRERIEWRSQPTKVDDFRVLSRLTVGMDWTVSDSVKVFAQLRDSRQFGDAAVTEFTAGSNAVVATDDTSPEFHQVYAFMKDAMGLGMDLKFGRQELVFGSSRMLGNADWGNVGRSFEGLRANGSLGDLAYSAFMMQVSHTTNTYADIRLYGAYGTMTLAPDLMNADIYALLLTNDTTDNHLQTVGVRLWGNMDMFSYEGEFAAQQNQSKDAATVDFNDAYLAAGNVGFSLGDMDGKPRLGFRYDMGSGMWTDLFPTNHARFGHSDILGTHTNHVHTAATFHMDVMDGWTFGIEHHWNRAFAQAGSDAVNTELDITLTGKCSDHLYMGIFAGRIFNKTGGYTTFGTTAPWVASAAGDHTNDGSFAMVQFTIPF